MVHDPQLSVPPQPSGPLPHCQPNGPPHVAQTHAWAPLHTFPPGQPLQSIRTPQLSMPVPHCHPSCAHVFDTHPQTFAVPPPPHVCGVMQAFAGHVIVPLQLSLTVPHWPGSHAVFGVHAVAPHLFGPPPPQNCLFAGHGVPFEQSSGLPGHPVGKVPQSKPAGHVEAGMHWHVFATH